MAGKKQKARGFLYEKTYNFIDKDPVLDAAKTIMQRSGKSFKEIHEAGGATPGTMNRWWNGNARTCRFDSLMATIRACEGDIYMVTKTGTRITITPKK